MANPADSCSFSPTCTPIAPRITFRDRIFREIEFEKSAKKVTRDRPKSKSGRIFETSLEPTHVDVGSDSGFFKKWLTFEKIGEEPLGKNVRNIF
jgi:hypothetical protein